MQTKTTSFILSAHQRTISSMVSSCVMRYQAVLDGLLGGQNLIGAPLSKAHDVIGLIPRFVLSTKRSKNNDMQQRIIGIETVLDAVKA